MNNNYIRRYELQCEYDGRKSFYNKANVEVFENELKLFSYSTHVASIFYNQPDKQDPEIYNMQSATTLRHIKEFFQQSGFEPMSKSQLEKWCVIR